MEWCVVTLIENSNIYQDFYLFGEFFKIHLVKLLCLQYISLICQQMNNHIHDLPNMTSSGPSLVLPDQLLKNIRVL